MIRSIHHGPRTEPDRRPPERQAAGWPDAGRGALVPVAPFRPNERIFASRPRPSAAFLAQLIATAQQAPQTRERRRVEPAIAMKTYAAANVRRDPAVPVTQRTM